MPKIEAQQKEKKRKQVKRKKENAQLRKLGRGRRPWDYDSD